MKIKDEDLNCLADLLWFVRDKQPVVIEMTKKQLGRYKSVVNQRVSVPKYKFMRIPIEVYEPER